MQHGRRLGCLSPGQLARQTPLWVTFETHDGIFAYDLKNYPAADKRR